MTREYPESDPRHHVANIKRMLAEVRSHCRDDLKKVDEPKAQAMIETIAEAVGGLETACDHYERGTEAAMRPES
jgi:hypothetical protein